MKSTKRKHANILFFLAIICILAFASCLELEPEPPEQVEVPPPPPSNPGGAATNDPVVRTNGVLEGTSWVGHNSEHALSFSRDTVTVAINGIRDVPAGTWPSFLDNNNSVQVRMTQGSRETNVNLGRLGNYVFTANTSLPRQILFPAPDILFIAGKYRFLDDWAAEEVDGGLAIVEYTGSRRDLVIPSQIGGIPVVTIGNGLACPFQSPYNDASSVRRNLQITSIVIPPSVTTIKPGAFISNDLLGYIDHPVRYLSGGITIGADVNIMGENVVINYHGSGALDPDKIRQGNFIARERRYLGYWLDIGFVDFYNGIEGEENRRRAGHYFWTNFDIASDYATTFRWAFTPR